MITEKEFDDLAVAYLKAISERDALQEAFDTIQKNLVHTLNSLEKADANFMLMEQRKDDAYHERNKVVACLAKCFHSGVAKTAIEGWSEDWHNCVYIDLPSGQVSWHYHDSQAYLFNDLPLYNKEWDGHSTEEKYARVLNPFNN